MDAGFVRSTGTPAPPIGLGIGGKTITWPGLVFVVGLLLAVVLMIRKVKGAIPLGIVFTTVPAIVVESIAKVGSGERGWSLDIPRVPTERFGLPDLSWCVRCSSSRFY